MPIFHYTPPTNDKRELTKADPPGWYEIAYKDGDRVTSKCRLWSGREWNHGPNMRRGWGEVGEGVLGITRLMP